MENDVEAKQLALEFIKRYRAEGRTLETVANTAGWVLQIIAHVNAQRRNCHPATTDLRDQG